MKNLRMHRCDACPRVFKCWPCPHRLRGGEYLPEAIYCTSACRERGTGGHGRRRAGSSYRTKVDDLEAKNLLVSARDLYLKKQPRQLGT